LELWRPSDFKSLWVFLFLITRKRGGMMSKRIYVGNLSFKSTEEDLRELFSKSGEVESVKIITDVNTGNPKGFGFVEMATPEDAKKAIEALNGTSFMDRSLAVSEARPQQARDRRGGFGGRKDSFGAGRGSSGKSRGTGRGWR
jgi:RNA recognition motif-containing protein